MNHYRIKIANYFDTIRNQILIFTKGKIEQTQIHPKTKLRNFYDNSKNEIDRFYLIQQLFFVELKSAEDINNSRLDSIELLRESLMNITFSNICENLLCSTIYYKFPFCLIWKNNIYLIIISDGFLTQNQISILQLVVLSQDLAVNQSIKWWIPLLFSSSEDNTV